RWPRDWSSDVCSSDLPCRGYFGLGETRDDGRQEPPALGGVQPSRRREQGETSPRLGGEDPLQRPRANDGRGGNPSPGKGSAGPQIGRASCRERVEAAE